MRYVLFKRRGAVNVEYIILIVVGALAVVIGLGYLSTTMNDKHTVVGGEISEVEGRSMRNIGAVADNGDGTYTLSRAGGNAPFALWQYPAGEGPGSLVYNKPNWNPFVIEAAYAAEGVLLEENETGTFTFSPEEGDRYVITDAQSDVVGSYTYTLIQPLAAANQPLIVEWARDTLTFHDYNDNLIPTTGHIIADPTGGGKGTIFSTNGKIDPVGIGYEGYGMFVANTQSVFMTQGLNYTVTCQYYLANPACSYEGLMMSWYSTVPEYDATYTYGTETVRYVVGGIEKAASQVPMPVTSKGTWLTWTQTITPRRTGHHRIGLETGYDWAPTGDIYLTNITVTQP